MSQADAPSGFREPSLADVLLPLGALAVLIAGSLALFGLDALDGPIQVALVMCCAVTALLAYLSIRKVPASLALLAATLFAGVLGAFLQPDVYTDSSPAAATPPTAAPITGFKIEKIALTELEEETA